MKYLCCVLFLVCVFFTPSYSATVSYNKLSAIEKQLFGYEYKNDAESRRLDRIETYLYSKTYTTSSASRLEKIAKDIGFVDKTEVISNAANKTNTIASNSQKPQLSEPEDPTVEYPIVDKIESKVFNKKFNGENIYRRLDRLELKVYGNKVDDSLSNRVNKLRISVMNDNLNDDFITGAASPSDNYYDTIPSRYDDDDSAITQKLPADNSKYNYSSPNVSRSNVINSELSVIEQKMFNQSFANDDMDKRLSRVELQIFKRNFAKDAPSTRLQRISAVNSAQKTSKMYDNNKMMRNWSTGVQVGSIILMILAMIL